MTPRIDVVANAALTFANTRCTRRQTPPSVLNSVLPETAKDMEKVALFEQKTVVPRGLLKGFVSSIIVRVLAKQVGVHDVVAVLTDTERDYVLSVLDEVYAWAESQGFETAPPKYDEAAAS